MKVITTEQMRELDRRTISDFGIHGEVLMERAGSGIAHVVDWLARTSGFERGSIRMFSGKGNNGGDVFCTARLLNEMGYQVDVWLAGRCSSITGAALKHLDMMRLNGVDFHEISTPDGWKEMMALPIRGQGIIVDGVIGTGGSGPAHGVVASAIQYINTIGDTGPIVSVDIPSGLDSDTGKALGDVVIADITVTLGMPKRGLVMPPALEFVGNLEVVDIGIPRGLSNAIMSDLDLITSDDLKGLVPRRARCSHKGSYGHLLIISGAAGYAGAAILAAKAATRSGVGLVSVLVPECIASIVASSVPEAMVHAGSQTELGSLSADMLLKWSRRIEEFDVLVVGPGITTHEASRHLICHILEEWKGPMVLDADALNVMGANLDKFKKSKADIVITPHPGEMGRIFGISAQDVQKKRFGIAAKAAMLLGAVVVLKGAGTIVAKEGAPISVNLTGNPGLARGGMGDILAGLLGGLLAQNMTTLDASRLAVYLHGRAADHVAWATSQAAMNASDVVENISVAYSELIPR